MILLLNDNPRIRQGLPSMDDVVEATGPTAAVQLATDRKPSVILVDSLFGGDVLATLHAAAPLASVVVLAEHGTYTQAARLFRRGASAYVDLPDLPLLLVQLVAKFAARYAARASASRVSS